MGLVGFAPNLTDCIGGQGKNKFRSSGAHDWIGYLVYVLPTGEETGGVRRENFLLASQK